MRQHNVKNNLNENVNGFANGLINSVKYFTLDLRSYLFHIVYKAENIRELFLIFIFFLLKIQKSVFVFVFVTILLYYRGERYGGMVKWCVGRRIVVVFVDYLIIYYFNTDDQEVNAI